MQSSLVCIRKLGLPGPRNRVDYTDKKRKIRPEAFFLSCLLRRHCCRAPCFVLHIGISVGSTIELCCLVPTRYFSRKIQPLLLVRPSANCHRYHRPVRVAMTTGSRHNEGFLRRQRPSASFRGHTYYTHSSDLFRSREPSNSRPHRTRQRGAADNRFSTRREQ